MDKRITIITPVYNDYGWLMNSLLPSVEKQTIGLDNIEMIVVDDGSDVDDETVNSLPPWVYYYEQKHSGGSVARNLGIENSTGEYLFFPDADVELFPDCLEKMLNVIVKNPQYTFVYSKFIMVEPGGWATLYPHSYRFKKELLEKLNFISACTLVKNIAEVVWNTKLKRFQDWALWIQLAGKGHTGYLIEEPLFWHFVRKKAISQTYKSYDVAKLEMFNVLNGKRKWEVEEVPGLKIVSRKLDTTSVEKKPRREV
jgi:glycosyltransferase involved in cell wall biosynthesis